MAETLGQLAAELKAAGARVTAAADVALRKTSQDIVGDAQALAPVDTGFLRSSISATVTGLAAEVGPTAEYGYFVEAGTGRMAPQPYLRPAFDRNVDSFLSAVEKAAAELL